MNAHPELPPKSTSSQLSCYKSCDAKKGNNEKRTSAGAGAAMQQGQVDRIPGRQLHAHLLCHRHEHRPGAEHELTACSSHSPDDGGDVLLDSAKDLVHA
mmetsp:Transcript_34130/g.106493  ORF Transcript_34130/g.106493 Transcript_34130/m.106493 type:complete len:99 (-) Transcript_34130:1171-1467(-)